MNLFLSIQSSYKILEILLFDNKKILDQRIEEGIAASRDFIVFIDEILKKNKLELSSLIFMAANQGPGAFITLRVILASLNGISFASKIPLIGIDGLEALLQEHIHKNITTVALLNAFNNEVYYAIKENRQVMKGYEKISSLLKQLKKTDKKYFFIGNGAMLFKKEISEALKKSAIFPETIPQTCSAKQLGLMALEKWKNSQISYQLLPLYLKSIKNLY